jgi:uncharacterized protein YjiS (DUF1127 family)
MLRTNIHEFWSLSMPTLIMRMARDGSQPHQKNWGFTFAFPWRELRRLRARQRSRRELRALADDPHLLKDIGVTRLEALEEADKPFWR